MKDVAVDWDTGSGQATDGKEQCSDTTGCSIRAVQPSSCPHVNTFAKLE